LARTPWAPGAPVLASAARAVRAVASLGESADEALAGAERGSERAAVRAVTLGSLRWYLRLEPAIAGLLARPKGLDPLVRALLVCAAHQVVYSRNAPERSVHAAVDAVRLLGKGDAAGLVNAVLRRFVSERSTRLASADEDLAVRSAHPRWLVEALLREWPAEAESILGANNAHPPLTLRIDLARISREAYREELIAAGIDSTAVPWIGTALTLDHPRSVAELPGFAQGRVSVQDAGAQLAAPLLELAPGQRVLDACAAPGGKTGLLLEATGGFLELTAVDVDPERVGLIRENLRRLGREARTVVGDLAEPGSFWDGEPFARVLVDAPCSSTGVIRRHPDIKLLRRSTDIPAFAERQLRILRGACSVLAPGGRLLYSTCSVLPQENERLVQRLLEEKPEMRVARMPGGAELAPGGRERAVGTQLLPGAEAGTDGFYYACLEKTTAGT